MRAVDVNGTAPFYEWFPDPVESVMKSDGYRRRPSIKQITLEESDAKQKYARALLERAFSKQGGILRVKGVGNEFIDNTSESMDVLSNLVRGGTSKDRVAALTLLLVECAPMHLDKLDQLVRMCRKKSREESMEAAKAARDLFIEHLLPSHRPLRPFATSCAWIERLHKTSSSKQKKQTPYLYIMAEVEDRIWEAYGGLVLALEQGSKDLIHRKRDLFTKIISELLVAKPERESQLLDLLVEKLADPEAKLGAKALYLLTHDVLFAHPGMKGHVIRSIESLYRRKGLKAQGRFYAMSALSYIQLEVEDVEHARRLLVIYVSVFRTRTEELGTKKKETAGDKLDLDSRLMSVILKGIKRVFGILLQCKEKVSLDELHVLYDVVDNASIKRSAEALMLLSQMMRNGYRNTHDLRFHAALYRTLLSHDLFSSTSAFAMLLNVLYISLKEDADQARATALLLRLLGVCALPAAPASFVCAALLMCSTLFQEKKYLETALCAPTVPTLYQPFVKDPIHAHALNSPVWPLYALMQHYHPSVRKWASFVMNGEPIETDSDPLDDFSFSAFLEHFVTKKPRKGAVSGPDRVKQFLLETQERDDTHFYALYMENRKKAMPTAHILPEQEDDLKRYDTIDMSSDESSEEDIGAVEREYDHDQFALLLEAAGDETGVTRKAMARRKKKRLR